MRVVTDYNSFESLLLGPRLGLEFLVAPGFEVGSTRRVEQCRNRGYMRQNVLGLSWHAGIRSDQCYSPQGLPLCSNRSRPPT